MDPIHLYHVLIQGYFFILAGVFATTVCQYQKANWIYESNTGNLFIKHSQDLANQKALVVIYVYYSDVIIFL